MAEKMMTDLGIAVAALRDDWNLINSDLWCQSYLSDCNITREELRTALAEEKENGG